MASPTFPITHSFFPFKDPRGENICRPTILETDSLCFLNLFFVCKYISDIDSKDASDPDNHTHHHLPPTGIEINHGNRIRHQETKGNFPPQRIKRRWTLHSCLITIACNSLTPECM